MNRKGVTTSDQQHAGLVNRFYGQLTVKMVDANAQTIEISCRDNNPFLVSRHGRGHG